ncbi:MAG: hypothetical protein ABIO67_03980, partial [Mycobacteriales bacterium]
VPAADVAAGKVADGFRCNIEVVGHSGVSGGFKVERYVDKAGHECAYYDTTLAFPSNIANIAQKGTGVAVLDMTDPAKPVVTTNLLTPAMDSPHESLLLNQRRGLLAAVAGNAIFAPGQVDVYDVSADCRAPVLQSTLPTGVLGHEAGFSPDGKTYYAASLGGGTITAVDLTNPKVPGIAAVLHYDTHSLSISDDGTRAYLAAGAGFPRNEVGLPAEVSGLRILDITDIQKRVLNPQTKTISTLTWPEVTIPQAQLPITIGGHPYLIDIDEFSTDADGRIANTGPNVGAARIIDIADETAPRVVSNMRLSVHQPENRAALLGDPGTSGALAPTSGYAGHYCAVPQRTDPGIVACSFLASGLRVFDIRDPFAPKEIAYFVAPVPAGGAANGAYSSASFVPERKEIWYSDSARGFYALRVTNGAWPQSGVSAPAAPTPAAAPVSAPRPRVAVSSRRPGWAFRLASASSCYSPASSAADGSAPRPAQSARLA